MRGGAAHLDAAPLPVVPLNPEKIQLIGFMRNVRQRWIDWVIARVQEDAPIRQHPRNSCGHHAAGCYLCPREHCIGMLNNRDDPDPEKPRPFTSGHCVYMPGGNGGIGMRVNMTLQGANEYYKKRAIDRGYSDISTREMILADWTRLDQAPSKPNPTPLIEAKRQARPGDVVF